MEARVGRQHGCVLSYRRFTGDSLLIVLVTVAGGIAGFVGNPGGMLLLLSEEFTTLIKYWI